MARTYSAAEANRNFSKILREVAGGERVIVTSRGKPVAEIGPTVLKSNVADADEKRRDFNRFLDRLKKQPALNLPKFSRDDFYE